MVLRYCKKCKVTFLGEQCPEGHANFMYTKKIPDKAGPELLPGGNAVAMARTQSSTERERRVAAEREAD